MNPYTMAKFILSNHTALSENENASLRRLLTDEYSCNPVSVQKLHDITILYHEANGIKKAAKS